MINSLFEMVTRNIELGMYRSRRSFLIQYFELAFRMSFLSLIYCLLLYEVCYNSNEVRSRRITIPCIALITDTSMISLIQSKSMYEHVEVSKLYNII